MTVQLDPCPVCGFAAWPEGGMHAARAIHMREHERKGETVDSWVDPGRDTAKFPVGPRVVRDRPGRAQITVMSLVALTIVMAGLVGVAFACAWGVTGIR